MSEGLPSMTAVVCALARAIHTRLDPAPIFDDPWGDLLVPSELKASLRLSAIAALGSDHDSVLDDWIRANAFYSVLITRSRYTEDALAGAIGRGIRQYVILGAGFDSYALRRPSSADDLAVYEIDQLATQSLKVERMALCGVAAHRMPQFLPADMAREELGDVLARSTFRPGQPTFFSWLGVSGYLTRDANLKTLRAIASNTAPGSELVFTYHDQASFQKKHSSEDEPLTTAKQWTRSVGEPHISGFHPHELEFDLRSVGLELLEDLNDQQAVKRYDPEGLNGLTPPPVVRIAHARVI